MIRPLISVRQGGEHAVPLCARQLRGEEFHRGGEVLQIFVGNIAEATDNGFAINRAAEEYAAGDSG